MTRNLSRTKTKKFIEAGSALRRLRDKYGCYRINLLRTHLSSAKSKTDRELFYGALFGKLLSVVNKHQYLVYIPEADEDCDCELLDYTKYQMKRKPGNNGEINHYLLQNVQITNQAVVEQIKKGSNDIYDTFTAHLVRTKLSNRAGDYSGCILVFYVGIRLSNKISLKKLRDIVRKIKQDKFRQIWLIAPNNIEYGIAELLHSDKPLDRVVV